MQFIPSTWASSGRDGDGDGVADPNDIDDAALAAADYLCGPGGVGSPTAMAAAIFRYNPSSYYVALVTSFAEGFGSGSFAIPSPPAPGCAPGCATSPAGSPVRRAHWSRSAAARPGGWSYRAC